MRLINGARAPLFDTTDIHGKPVSLAGFRGTSLLLSFFRYGSCALCNLRIRQLIQRYPDYAARGLRMVAVFESGPDRVLASVGRQEAPFPIVADPGARLYDLYGVEASAERVARTIAHPDTASHIAAAAEAGFALTREPGGNFDRLPADFLIDPDLGLARVHYAGIVTDHLPFEAIEGYLAHPALVASAG